MYKNIKIFICDDDGTVATVAIMTIITITITITITIVQSTIYSCTVDNVAHCSHR